MQIFPISKRYIQGPDFMELDQNNLNEQLEFAKVNNVDGFVITHDRTKELFPSLDFLLDANVRGLVISFDAVKDISAINKFYELEVLQFGWMSYPTSEIDLSNFKNLRVLGANWNKHVKNFETLSSVVRLNLWGYKPNCRNLKELRNCNNLVYVRLVQPGINTLEGIENLERLQELDLGNVRSLNQFIQTEKSFTSPLQKLTFSTCPNFDINTISAINSLKYLGFSQIGKRSTLKNILPKFPNLESIGFTQSELVEGNLEYFLKHPTLKKIIIDNKKHYNLKEKEIQKYLDEKHKIN